MVGTTVYRRRADPGAQVTIEFDASQILNFDVRYVPRERDDEVEILIFRFRANEPGSTGWSYPGDRSALTGGAGVFHDGR